MKQPANGSSIALLGPQSPTPCLSKVLRSVDSTGAYGVITAGWRDTEGEVGSLTEHIGANVVDLKLYRRVDDVFSADPTLFEAHRARQDRLRQLQQLYRVRLRAGAEACYRLLSRHEEPALVKTQLRAAVGQLRMLDRFHARQIAAVHADFERQLRPFERPSLRQHQRELTEMLGGLDAVLIAGGHVAVLASRMRLLGMARLLSGHSLIGWSAGAMMLTDRLILFHDHAPQGRREPELLDVGLGRRAGIVALPSARQRLDLGKRDQLKIMAGRFSPARCVTLDAGAFVVWRGDRLSAAHGARRIKRNGSIAEVNINA